MVEGVWDDDFERGDFHRSENFFGSGIRIDGDSVYFVPSSALVDRLLFCKDDGSFLCSNSLIFLPAERTTEILNKGRTLESFRR
ncbi:MAG: hypothetical protein ACFFCW_23650 [Candidatus Hodarchaeota archaeon]